nr:imidazolonepropionase [Geodermatophilaceae bacterium]
MSENEQLFVNAAQVVTCSGPARARRGAEMDNADVRTGTAVLVRDDIIARVDEESVLRAEHSRAAIVDCDGGIVTPGFVDSHTHAIFGRARYEEQELRAAGVPYMEIARRGGGIHASVRDLRERSEDELLSLAIPRLRALAASGVTTVEVKSGYGLSLESELAILRVVRRLAG